MKKIVLLSAVSLSMCFSIFLYSCGGGAKTEEKKESNPTNTIKDGESESGFPFPEIPSTLVSPEERKVYLLAHFWDNFPFSDTATVNNPAITEQGFADFISLLKPEDDKFRQDCMKTLCGSFEKDPNALRVFSGIIDDYLHNPNSPYYDEGLYLAYLRYMLDSNVLDDLRKSTLKFRFDLLNRNNPGQTATDFSYYRPDGSKSSLRQTPVKGEYLLLAFYDPECESCHEVLKEMGSDEKLAEAVARNKLTVLAVYTEGNEDAWKRALPSMPSGWVIGTDHEEVKGRSLYDLKAMPSLYLLDKTKNVLLKDVSYAAIRSYVGLPD